MTAVAMAWSDVASDDSDRNSPIPANARTNVSCVKSRASVSSPAMRIASR